MHETFTLLTSKQNLGLQVFIAQALLKCLTVANQGKNPDVVSATSNSIKSKQPATVPYMRINTI